MDTPIEEHRLYETPPEIRADPLLAVCRKFADKCHATFPQPTPPNNLKRMVSLGYWGAARPAEGKPGPVMREKPDGIKIPYLTHPCLTVRILLAAGQTDSVELAAALLHDVVEECFLPAAKADHPNASKAEQRQIAFSNFEDQLRELLTDYYPDSHPKKETLSKEAVDDIVSRITQRVREVTNPESMLEGKVFWQATHARTMSGPAKQLKMADLAASMICDLLVAPKDHKTWPFACKALAVAEACRSADPKLYYLIEHLRDVACSVVQKNNVRQRREFRESFDLERALGEAAETVESLGVDGRAKPEMKWLKSAGKNVSKGLIAVAFDEAGKVTGFRMLTKPDANEQDACNKTMNAMLTAMQSDGNYAQIGQSRMTENQHHSRSFTLMRYAVPLDVFLAIADKAEAIDPAFKKQLSAGTSVAPSPKDVAVTEHEVNPMIPNELDKGVPQIAV